MSQTVAILGGSFNPPGMHHRRIAQLAAEHCDSVVVVPCGPRPDKPVTDDVPPIYRAAMVDMTFRGLPRVRVDLFDLEQPCFTRSHLLAQRYQQHGEIWHVLDAQLLQGGGQGESTVQRQWEQGAELWQRGRFLVVARPDAQPDPDDLPPTHRVLTLEHGRVGAEIRNQVFHHRSVEGLVQPEVARYIERHRLYRGMRPSRTTRFDLQQLRPLVVADPRNPEALEVAAGLGQSHQQDPNLIVVVGGDGTMLRAIRSEWRRRVPFYGINTGHLGFLLNRRRPTAEVLADLELQQLPLLWVETERPDGTTRTSLAFNDAWVERATGQTAWLNVTVDGRERLPRLVADGALVSTAAGSTSYARAMGAPPMPLNTPALLLVGSNVLLPVFWKQAVLSLESTIKLTTLDPDKRPLHGYVDGVHKGKLRSMTARVSNTAAVELAFDRQHDPAEKLASIQFPLSE